MDKVKLPLSFYVYGRDAGVRAESDNDFVAMIDVVKVVPLSLGLMGRSC